MLIQKQIAHKDFLRGKTILLTGAGGGIGLEALKSFAYMGAKTIIAELDKAKGLAAAQNVNELYGEDLAEFYEIDLSDKSQIDRMSEHIFKNYGCPDVIFNNATAVKIGTVETVSLDFWEKSYAVNFRAPLMLTQRFLPAMRESNSGIIVFVSSSGAAPYMGAYEVFKTAQVELCNTLAMEPEGTNVYTYTIGPGLVKTQTAMDAITIIASKMGMETEDFYNMNKQIIIDAEQAGAGFALSVKNAASYHGQEISSVQVLMEFSLIENEQGENTSAKTESMREETKEYFQRILTTYAGQYDGWMAMNVFQKQWVLRDVKKYMAYSAEQVYAKLKMLGDEIQNGMYEALSNEKSFLEKLKEYWKHQLKLLQDYEKDQAKCKENTRIIESWISDIEKVLE